jgi:hypothetical protein
MQIHELNNKRKVATEATGFGPLDSAINAGKAVLQNKSSFWNSAALGTAQQQAAAASAAASAKELANPGSQALSTRKLRGSPAYTVGGSAKQTTPQQQLAQTQANPAVQQLVKNLAAQWKPQGVAAAAKIKTAPVTESPIAIADPASVKDPQDRAILDKLYTQNPELAPKLAQPPTPDAKAKANEKLNAFATEFQNWAEPKLRAAGVDYNTVMRDPWANKTVQSLLTSIAIESMANPESAKTNSLVEQFFNVVIATNQTQNQGSGRSGGFAAASPGGAAVSADDQSVLKKYGVALNQSQLDQLGQGMRRASGGGTVIKNTNNELLNAVARLAGFQIGR